MCTKDGWGGQPVVIKCVCVGPLERRLCEKDVQATDLPQPDGHERHWESAHMSGFCVLTCGGGARCVCKLVGATKPLL